MSGFFLVRVLRQMEGHTGTEGVIGLIVGKIVVPRGQPNKFSLFKEANIYLF